jgi:ankyrin repeat protein
MRITPRYLIILALMPLLLHAQTPVDPSRDLFYAIFDNNYNLAEMALNQGANPNSVYIYERYSDECRNWLPAHSAAAIGNVKIMKLLKKKGADFSKTMNGDDSCQAGSGLLHIAAGYGSLEALDFLLSEGLPVDSKAADERTPLFDAVMSGKYETAKMLLDKGANPNHLAKVCTLKTMQTALHSAIELQNHNIFDLLLDKGAKIDQSKDIEPLLHWAIRCENLQAAYTLILKGADPNLKNAAGVTALQLAKKSENARLGYLLETKSLTDRDRKILSLMRNDVMKKFKLIMRKAPEFQFGNMNGTKVSSSSFKGKLLIVNIWATWCSPCIKEMPTFKEMLKKLNRADMEMLCVSIDQKLIKVQDFVAKNSYPFIFLHDPEAKVRSMFYGAVPATFIINKKGEWVARVEGSTEWDRKEVRTFLQYLADEK